MNTAALRRLWAWPTALGAGISFGLVCALVADGSWDVTGALCLAVPGAFCLWLTARRPVRRRAADAPLNAGGVGPDRGPSSGRITDGHLRDGQ